MTTWQLHVAAADENFSGDGKMLRVELCYLSDGDPRHAPFVVLSNPWSDSGYFSLNWIGCTPDALRMLASDLEAANADFAEKVKPKLASGDLRRVSEELDRYPIVIDGDGKRVIISVGSMIDPNGNS